MPIGHTNIHKPINVLEFINKLSFICVLWIKSFSEMKWSQNNPFSTTITSNSEIETLVSFSRSTNIDVNIYFANSNCERNFSTYAFGKSFWHYCEGMTPLCKQPWLLYASNPDSTMQATLTPLASDFASLCKLLLSWIKMAAK